MSIQELIDSKEAYTLVVKPQDLQDFAQIIVKGCLDDLQRIIDGRKKDKLVPATEAKKLLGRCDKTLWKWAKVGFLVPTKIGRANYYRLSDINRILGIH